MTSCFNSQHLPETPSPHAFPGRPHCHHCAKLAIRHETCTARWVHRLLAGWAWRCNQTWHARTTPTEHWPTRNVFFLSPPLRVRAITNRCTTTPRRWNWKFRGNLRFLLVGGNLESEAKICFQNMHHHSNYPKSHPLRAAPHFLLILH